ncbi:peptidase inhibitor family I36 protein [Streptomyces ipomoeae]|uniref:peptidase inhibitor family I36 protein n=1 Tax=Streptomyces ipomoeae TaxID=103232 RepID=UPI001147234B|nr:peptidase inhibitor family I36 protein [Streptomyces ipomoeae]MDX2939827.1 hypothetical protein [Streptomyces ipomoeae]TQE32216.1 hypothetical protein SipoB123_00125 [Streptomyces ipomoeae]
MKKAIPFKQVTAVAAALATAGLLSVGATASTAAASSSTDTGIQATGYWRAYASTGFTGGDKLFSGTTGTCYYVGDSWNDSVRSARTRAPARVLLWENYNCTGDAIIIDSEGYSSIGSWVSAYSIV